MISARRRTGALLLVCRALGSDAWSRTPLARALCPAEPSWDAALALAADTHVATALSGAIDRRRLRVPPGIAEELRRHQLLNTVRNVRFRECLSEAVLALNAAGIEPLLFKGALELAASAASVLSDRWMDDLDLLVQPEQMAAAGQALQTIGYGPEPGRAFMHPHELPYTRHGAPGPIELHSALGSRPLAFVLPAAEAWEASSELGVGSGRGRALTPTHRVLHNVLHSTVQDLNHAVGGLPLRQLVILSRLASDYEDALDWPWIHSRMQEHGLSRQLRDHLWLTHRLAGMALPAVPRPRGRVIGREIHEARVLANFALGWPADAHRNLRFAFGRAYLDSLYGHGNRPLPLAAARARHAMNVARRDGAAAFTQTFLRRG